VGQIVPEIHEILWLVPQAWWIPEEGVQIAGEGGVGTVR